MVDISRFNCIFLDRDGVINVERPDDYVKTVEEFTFIEGSLEALRILNTLFEYIFVVTNQRGVGRGIMQMQELDMIHSIMLNEIENHGGKVTQIYSCCDVESTSVNRKPNTGMAFLAKECYPINFTNSVMVGNSRSDIEFGKKLGMYTVLVGDKYPENDNIYKSVDLYCKNLYTFANILLKKKNI